MAFSADDFLALLCEVFPTDQPATFADVALFLQRVKQQLDATGMPIADQRLYVEEELGLLAVLADKAVFDAERPGREATDAEVRETVTNWLAVFFPPTPVEGEPGDE